MTLRRAVDLLVAEQRLIRRQGSGTFVAAPKVTQRLTATSFSADMRARGLRPGGHTVFARTSPAGMMRAGLLGVPPHAHVLHVRRLRMADDEPMALEDLHVPLDVAPGLTGEDLEDTSFYDLLASRYGTPIASGTQTVEPCLTSAEEADLLGWTPAPRRSCSSAPRGSRTAGSRSSCARSTAATATGSWSTSSPDRLRPMV